jgi:hypothetical protein
LRFFYNFSFQKVLRPPFFGDSFSQFQQHFISSFSANILSTKIY